MAIKPPLQEGSYPNRHIDCQEAIEDELLALVARAVAVGWTHPDLWAALVDLADNSAIGDAELARTREEIDQFLSKKRPD